MSITKKQSRILILKVLFISVIFCSCENNGIKTKSSKNNITELEKKPEVEASLLVAMADLSKAILIRNEQAKESTNNNRIKNFSKVIERNQNNILYAIREIADDKLIMINSLDDENLIDNSFSQKDTNKVDFDKAYFVIIRKDINQQIALLETISKETKDFTILKFAFEELEQQRKMLTMLTEFEEKIINNKNIPN